MRSESILLTRLSEVGVQKAGLMMVFVLLVTGCTAHRLASNPLAAELSREDQAARTGQEVPRTDQDRIKLMLDEIASGRIATPEDKFNAALVLQHSPLSFRDGTLVAISPDNYLLAHYLARSSYQAGYQKARLLVAQTLDRYLSLTTGCQKYGTNRFINQDTGAEELAPIDRRTTDEERLRYDVPPLATLVKQFPEQQRACR